MEIRLMVKKLIIDYILAPIVMWYIHLELPTIDCGEGGQ